MAESQRDSPSDFQYRNELILSTLDIDDADSILIRLDDGLKLSLLVDADKFEEN